MRKELGRKCQRGGYRNPMSDQIWACLWHGSVPGLSLSTSWFPASSEASAVLSGFSNKPECSEPGSWFQSLLVSSFTDTETSEDLSCVDVLWQKWISGAACALKCSLHDVRLYQDISVPQLLDRPVWPVTFCLWLSWSLHWRLFYFQFSKNVGFVFLKHPVLWKHCEPW